MDDSKPIGVNSLRGIVFSRLDRGPWGDTVILLVDANVACHRLGRRQDCNLAESVFHVRRAEFDSVADATMYLALIVGLTILQHDVLYSEWPWFAAAGSSYLASLLFSWVKFRRLPSYHTRSAKTSWLLVTIAVIGLFGWGYTWPIRVAGFGVIIANLESIAITQILSKPMADVISFRRAWSCVRRTDNRVLLDRGCRGWLKSDAPLGLTRSCATICHESISFPYAPTLSRFESP